MKKMEMKMKIKKELKEGLICLLYDTTAVNVSPFVLDHAVSRRARDPRWIKLNKSLKKAMEEAWEIRRISHPKAKFKKLEEYCSETKKTKNNVDGLYGVKINWYGNLFLD